MAIPRARLELGFQTVVGASWVVTFLWSSFGAQVGTAVTPLPTVGCDASTGCTIDNANRLWDDRLPCKAELAVYPTTEQEILKAVAAAVKNKQNIKVGTKFGHSIPKFACPGTSSGVIISTKNYSSIVEIDELSMTVTAQGGIKLRDLLDGIAKQGLALPCTPYWDGLSLAGMLSMGAHGSSLFLKGGAVQEYVIGMRLVVPATAGEGYAKIVNLNKIDEDLNAAKVSLGVLGAISTVTLQLEHAFKRNVTFMVESDDGLEDRIFQVAKHFEFGDATWYPSSRRVLYRHDQRVSVTTPGDGRNNFFGFQAIPGTQLEEARSLEVYAEANRDEQLKCQLANISQTSQVAAGNGFVEGNGQIAPVGSRVIGQQYLIQSNSACTMNTTPGYYCSWDPQIRALSYFEASPAIPLRSLKSFIADVKALRDVDPSSFCGLDLYTGFLIRFVKKSTGAYLGAQEDVAMMDFDYYRGNDGQTPRLNQDVFDEIEQIAFQKYSATPHWGKNPNRAFEGLPKKYKDIDKFIAVKKKFDPQGLFSSAWSNAVLGVAKRGAPSVSTFQPYCGIEGLCICTKDIHCNPEKKYFCRQGKVYPAANVCRFEYS